MTEQVPSFTSTEEANAHIASLYKGSELLKNQPTDQPKPPDEGVVRDLVAKELEVAKQSLVDEKEVRYTKALLSDDDNVNAIKRTFKEEKEFEQWHTEAKEGKASNKEIELLVDRGKNLIDREAKEAERVKEAEVAKAKEDANKPIKRTVQEAHDEIAKIQTDPKGAFSNMGQFKDKATQQKLLAEECTAIANILSTVEIDKLNAKEQALFMGFNEMIMDIQTSAVNNEKMLQYAKDMKFAQEQGYGGAVDHTKSVNPDGSTVATV